MNVDNKDRRLVYTLMILAIASCLAACSVVSPNVRDQAVDLGFSKLADKPDAYIGQTVILGGYVAEVLNLADKSRLMVLQAPLDFKDEPKSRQASKGRFMIVTEQFLDPMVYEKGRKVTVAGTVAGKTSEMVAQYAYQMPMIKASELHLWEEWQPRRWPYYDDPFCSWWDSPPYYRWHRPYRW